MSRCYVALAARSAWDALPHAMPEKGCSTAVPKPSAWCSLDASET
jgi:hypothetical protein